VLGLELLSGLIQLCQLLSEAAELLLDELLHF
jgi:hypothetical protein